MRIKAVALNHLDLWGFRGMAFAKRQLPLVVGAEASAEIAAVGAGVTGFKPGDRVVMYGARPAASALPAAKAATICARTSAASWAFTSTASRAISSICRRGWSSRCPPASLARRRLRADRLRHRRAHAVRQCQAQAGRNHPGACRRLRHRLGRDQDGQGDRLHRHHHGRRRRQGGEGQGARRRSRHQLQDRALRGRHPQAHRQEGRRRGVRARRRRGLQRLAALPQARRAAGDLRLDRRADRDHQSDAAVPAAVQDLRLVRLLDAQYPRQPVEDGRRHDAGDRYRGSRSPISSAAWRGWKAGRCSAKSS